MGTFTQERRVIHMSKLRAMIGIQIMLMIFGQPLEEQFTIVTLTEKQRVGFRCITVLTIMRTGIMQLLYMLKMEPESLVEFYVRFCKLIFQVSTNIIYKIIIIHMNFMVYFYFIHLVI